MRTALHDTSNPALPWAGTACLLGWLAGCALQLQQATLADGAWVAAAALAGGAAALAATRGPSGWRGWVVWLLAAALLGWAGTSVRAQWRLAEALAPALDGAELEVTGRIAGLVQQPAWGRRWPFEVASARYQGQPVQVPSRVLLSWYADGDEALAPAPWQPGERWQFTVRLRAPRGLLNPQGWDEALWLWEQGLLATGSVRAAHPLPGPPGFTLDALRQTTRDAILRRLQDGRPESQRIAGVVAALVVGDQNAIDRADWEVFRTTGVAHLMSISGLHITLFAWLAGRLLGGLWRGSARRGWRWCLRCPAPTVGAWGGLALAALYAVFSGWGVPAQRTVLMLACLVLLRTRGQRWPAGPVWLLAAAVVTLWDPWALLQAGFWLSFIAVGVLMLAGQGDMAHRDGAKGAGFQFGAFLGRHGRQLLREQGVVTLALSPLTLLLFGQVSVVGFLANLLAIPWVTLLVTPLALLGVLWPPLWDGAAAALQPLVAGLHALSGWPGVTWEVAQAPLPVGLLGILGGGLLVLRLPWPLRTLGVPLLLPVLCWQVPRPAPGTFELLAADIGQGNAVLVRTAHHSLLYDSGPRTRFSDAGQRVLVPLLRTMGERLDALVLSHRDSDHTGGAPAVLAQQPQAWVLGSLDAGTVLSPARAIRLCARGQRWSWDGVDFEILHPGPQSVGTSTNARSCVLGIRAGAQRALLVGDIEAPQEAELLQQLPQALAADVLLVPHHGSKTSSSAAFVAAVRPRWALVQAGHQSRYGHPAPEVVARYAAQGSRVVLTPHCGAWRWASAEPQRADCERTLQRRYWHPPSP